MKYDEQGGRHPIIYDDAVHGFFDDYRFLSNFHVCQVMLDGMMFHSSEAAYMSRKTTDMEVKKALQLCNPKEAKQLGRSLEITDPEAWEFDRVIAMYDACWAKFSENEELRIALLNTGTKYLEETNDWGDKFWGADRFGAGRNMLGKVLMSIREKLK